jgi:NAD(P)-dependent dehydrogenase (short-subunit alcohol dehydrogenase family)
MNTAFITGHTSGLGAAFFRALSEYGWHCEGFSRSNGFDILDAKARSRILEMSSQANLFINNAHAGYAQAEMLTELFERWQHEPEKCIVNIGVDTVPASNWEVVYRAYPVEKVALHAAITRLQNVDHSCRIVNLALGHLDTESNSEYHGAKLPLDDVIQALDYVLRAPKHLDIKQITLGPR